MSESQEMKEGYHGGGKGNHFGTEFLCPQMKISFPKSGTGMQGKKKALGDCCQGAIPGVQALARPLY